MREQELRDLLEEIEVSPDAIDEAVRLATVGEPVVLRKASELAAEFVETLNQEPDWRKRAALAAKIISASLE